MKFLIVTDLDNTLVGDEDATESFNKCLEERREQFYLIYATGRSYASAIQLKVEAQLLEPDYWIVGVGSQIYNQHKLDEFWATQISSGWNREMVEEIAFSLPSLHRQTRNEQNPWKVSFHLDRAANLSIIEKLKNQIRQAGISAQVVFSSGRDVDILPEWSNKGTATTYLRQRLEIEPEATLVCGDSGNDISLFEQQTKGVIVNNAQPELLKWYYQYSLPCHYLARSCYAAGILEALKHFEFINSIESTSHR